MLNAISNLNSLILHDYNFAIRGSKPICGLSSEDTTCRLTSGIFCFVFSVGFQEVISRKKPKIVFRSEEYTHGFRIPFTGYN